MIICTVPAKKVTGTRRAKIDVTLSAHDALLATGSLKNWARDPGMMSRQSSEAPTSGGGAGSSGSSSTLPNVTPPAPSDVHEAEEAGESAAGFQDSLIHLSDGILSVPSSTWGGGVGTTPVDVSAPPIPSLFIVQVIGISSFLGDYGLGRTVKTFSLLPGESTTIHTRTWRASEESVSQASSIIDSFDESAADRFSSSVQSETTDTATQDKTENWYVDAEAGASFGVASASVSGGGAGEYSSSTEEFSRAVDEAVREHCAESSSHRETSVTSSSEASVSTEDEEVIERSIKNINVSRVLNFTFRELNQAYLTKTHLKDVRIAFSNGNSGAWREEPVASMRKLIAEVIRPDRVDAVCSDIIRTIAIVQSVEQLPVKVLEEVQLDPCSVRARVRDAQPDKNCVYAAPLADGRLYYRFKRGPLAQATDEPHPVEGVVVQQRDVMLASDSVVVEALLGATDALDDYSHQLQLETIREKKLANDRELLAQRIVSTGDTNAAQLFAQVFPPPVAEPPAV